VQVTARSLFSVWPKKRVKAREPARKGAKQETAGDDL
jgi:hypothetical protein